MKRGMTNMERPAPLRTPLCPAGHLPLKGGDWLASRPPPISEVEEWLGRRGRLISPLEGEMSGRTEGGTQGHRPAKGVNEDNGPSNKRTQNARSDGAPAEPSRVSGVRA